MRDPPASRAPQGHSRASLAGVAVAALGLVALLAAVHVTQGTADVGADDVWAVITGQGTDQAGAVVLASRVPRLLAGLVVGAALGMAGAALQSVARNALASPDTLGVNAGAYLAVVATAALGLSLPLFASAGVAFVGGLAAAGLVLALSAGSAGPTRLVLAGSATALALHALTIMLLLFAQDTVGLFAWGSGSLAQIGLDGVARMGPFVAVVAMGLLALAHRLDILMLGNDAASVLGVDVRSTRLLAVVLAVLASAAAVTVAGPIGFVGLCAPALVRLLIPLVPGLARHRALLPLSALAGVVVVLGADVAVRAVLGPQRGVEIPTGVVTTLVGAGVLVALAHRSRGSGPTRSAPAAGAQRLRGARTAGVIVAVAAVTVVGAALAAMLLGDALLLTGDVAAWATGRAGPLVTYVLDARVPRVLAALLAGAALAAAGTTIQAVCRNPLAEPGILGVSGGAGIGAVLVLTVSPLAGVWVVTGSAAGGALVACVLVFGLAGTGGLGSDRLVLIGVGVSAGATAVITFLIVLTDPFNGIKALTWLSGTTYGRTLPQLVPVAVALAVTLPLLASARHDLDLMALDDDTPRVLGVRLGAGRLWLLTTSALLTATAVTAIGVVGFVGLVAPHAARALVGSRHSRVLGVAVLLGALLVSVADTLGRTLIAPAQLPAGLLTAVIGTPYFVWLLWRSRTT